MGHLQRSEAWGDGHADGHNVVPAAPRSTGREPVVLVVEDMTGMTAAVQAICEFIGVSVVHVDSEDDLAEMLRRCRPMAVVSELDGREQDGCHVMMTVAEHDRTLPLLLVTGADAALAGAVDAVEEIWNLTGVMNCAEMPAIGEMVDFLFTACRKGRCLSVLDGS